MSWIYLLAAIGLGAWFLWDSWRVYLRPDEAMRLFTTSTVYMAALFASVMLDVTGTEGGSQVELADDPLFLEEGKYVLVLQKRDDEVKKFRSVLAIWDGGKEVKREPVEVNSPLEYKGYMFYQSNYDPRNLSYSGFSVVRDPGLGLVYAGFLLLSIGVIYVFYVRPRIIARKVQQAKEEV